MANGNDGFTGVVGNEETPAVNVNSGGENGGGTRVKPAWWDDRVELIGNLTWEQIQALKMGEESKDRLISSRIKMMRDAGFELNFETTKFEPAPEKERAGQHWTSEAEADAAALDLNSPGKRVEGEGDWYSVPLGENLFGLKQKPGADKQLSWDTIEEANVHIGTLDAKEQATIEATYNTKTDKYELTKLTTYDSLENIEAILGSGWTGDIDATGRFVPRQLSISGGTSSVSAMRKLLIDAGLDPNEHEIYEDFNAPTSQLYKVRPISTSSGRRFNSFAEANATKPTGWEVQGYMYEGNQYYKHVRSDDPDEDIKSFDDLILRTYMQDGPSAALRIDAFRDRVSRKAVTFIEAAQLAGSFAKNANDFKQMIDIIMQPPPEMDMSAFDTAVNAAAGDKFGTAPVVSAFDDSGATVMSQAAQRGEAAARVYGDVPIGAVEEELKNITSLESQIAEAKRKKASAPEGAATEGGMGGSYDDVIAGLEAKLATSKDKYQSFKLDPTDYKAPPVPDDPGLFRTSAIGVDELTPENIRARESFAASKEGLSPSYLFEQQKAASELEDPDNQIRNTFNLGDPLKRTYRPAAQIKEEEDIAAREAATTSTRNIITAGSKKPGTGSKSSLFADLAFPKPTKEVGNVKTKVGSF